MQEPDKWHFQKNWVFIMQEPDMLISITCKIVHSTVSSERCHMMALWSCLEIDLRQFPCKNLISTTNYIICWNLYCWSEGCHKRIFLAMDVRHKHYVWGADTECMPLTGNINSNIENFIYRRCLKPEIWGSNPSLDTNFSLTIYHLYQGWPN